MPVGPIDLFSSCFDGCTDVTDLRVSDLQNFIVGRIEMCCHDDDGSLRIGGKTMVA